ncbi:MAG TPA: class II aldolase/adducin family protein [Burkholderiales bacterium]|nr:class II aldolase/adducin family protein [Burkholderiales bacterium]
MNAPFMGISSDVRSMVSAEEWEARVNLAAAYRLMDHFELTDLISSHVSVRVPGKHDEFLINPYGLLYSQITASCLIRLDLQGRELFNPTGSYNVNESGFAIHSAVHAARPEVDCIIHAHTLSGMAVASMECGLLPIAQMSMRWAKGVSYHDYESIVDANEMDVMVKALGNNDVMILRNHGLLTCGRSIPECFNNMFWLKRSCDLQVMALSCNVKLRTVSDAVVDKTWSAYQPGGRRHNQQRRGLLEWPALLHELDRKDPSYKT